MDFSKKYRLYTLTTTKNFSSSLNDLLCDGGDEPLEYVHACRDAVVLHKRLPLLLKEYLNIFYAAINTESYSSLHFLRGNEHRKVRYIYLIKYRAVQHNKWQ
jgi:hypothetical protein